MVDTEELWSIGNLYWTFEHMGSLRDREQCAKLIGVKVANDKALAEAAQCLGICRYRFSRESAGRHPQAASKSTSAVFERTVAPDESWLLFAKAFAETDPERAMEAFRCACSMNPAMAYRVNPSWRLADLLKENGLVSRCP